MEYLNNANQWGTICDSNYGPTGWPTVACLELGNDKFINHYKINTFVTRDVSMVHKKYLVNLVIMIHWF